MSLEEGRVFVRRHDVERVVLLAELLHLLQHRRVCHSRDQHRLLFVIFARLLVERERVPFNRYPLFVRQVEILVALCLGLDVRYSYQVLVEFHLKLLKVVRLFHLKPAKFLVVLVKQIDVHQHLLRREAVFKVFIVRVKDINLVEVKQLL